MGAYRFIAFPPGCQPSVEEVNLLHDYAPVLNRHVAWGLDRRTGALAVALEAEPFVRAVEKDKGFAALVRRWESHGCAVVERLDFVKDSDALHPSVSSPLPGAGLAAGVHAQDHLIVAKQNVAYEALGRAKLAFDRTLQRHEALRRFAAVAPYLLMLAAIIGLFGAGWYVTDRMLSGPRERRRDTIERVVADPMSESLEAGARDAPASDQQALEPPQEPEPE
ncbi:MAG: hypothetical protein KDA44_01395 [Planctomycetales bacterium]|nr:hypothetical protein [Planctomycetales bacterium]